MNKLLEKLLYISLAFILTLGNIQRVSAGDLCEARPVAFMFFNGVQTDIFKANADLEELKRLHGTTSSSGDKIAYEVMYNYSNGFEDFVETFEQRLLEEGGLLEGRYELFFEALKGDGSWWSRIIHSVSEAAHILLGFVDWVKAAVVASLGALIEHPPTTVNYLEHRARLDNRITEGKKILLVAHSQGNLFANAAYNYARTKISSESVKVVHIAPASPILNGNHVLADKDLVINLLRTVEYDVASITDIIPGYIHRPASIISGERDILGHGLLEIYINQELDISKSVRSNINEALVTLVAPPVIATSGFFTATLTWDGSGDVDLHTVEPFGFHVFYASRSGESGYLDVDNITAYGPEHYFASCNSDKLQLGRYQISVANYRGAEGRTAAVQISSWADGVLGTRSAILGGATGSTPSVTFFNVLVTRDTETGKYSVSADPLIFDDPHH